VRSFLWLEGYYHKFVRDFSRVVAPLTNITKKTTKHEWTNKCEEAFQELKKRLISVPALMLPEEREHFVMYNYALRVGIGRVLMQRWVK